MTKPIELTGAAKRLFGLVKKGTYSRADLAQVMGKLSRETTTETQRATAKANGAKGGRPKGTKKSAK